MAHVVIIGGGFAGVWSAAGAALACGEADLRITLIAPNDVGAENLIHTL
jgi:NADH dehydrogenase